MVLNQLIVSDHLEDFTVSAFGKQDIALYA
jgi:hypothetical protein